MRKVVRLMQPAFGHFGYLDSPEIIRLRDNENPFGGKHNRYPDDTVKKLTTRYIQALDYIDLFLEPRSKQYFAHCTDGLLITRGASDALDLVFRAFFDPGRDSIAVTPPNFKLFNELATVYQITTHEIDLMGDKFNRLDVSKLMNKQTKGIFLCDPNNPMGTNLHTDDIKKLLECFQGLIIIDEAYVEYSTRRSYRFLIQKYPNLLIVRSMSKALGMAALRLGAVFAHPQLINALRKVRLPFALPSIVIETAIAELNDVTSLRHRIDTFNKERDRIADQLKACPCIEKVFADAGFITVKTDNETHKIIQRSGFDVMANPMGLEGYLRISLEDSSINNQLVNTLKHI